MKNPYTTIAGYLTLAATLVAYFGGWLPAQAGHINLTGVMGLLIGVIGILAKDGGH